MLNRVQAERPEDVFQDLSRRRQRGVYFLRVCGYSGAVRDFIRGCFEAARQNGVVIEGRLANPDNANLAYYTEIMGTDFRMDPGFINKSLKKWLPRMTDAQRDNVTSAIYDTLLGLRNAGKNDNMLKNAYIKFMCWLYYKFERIVGALGNEKLPKILYEGGVGTYELLLLNVLCIAGCDIILLQYGGDAEYRKTDPDSSRSQLLPMSGLAGFPEGFCLKQIREDMRREAENERLYGEKPRTMGCTNAWISGKVLEDVRQDIRARGDDPNLFYNCFCRINGAEDKLTYENDLYQLQLELRSSKRSVVIVSRSIDPPTVDEVAQVRRRNYQNITQLIADLCTNIQFHGNQELEKLMKKAFVDLMLEENKKDGTNLNRLTNKAVYLLCWLKRYQTQLLSKDSPPQVGCFFYMGGCRNDNEALLCRFLARLPVDVLIFRPNLNQACCLEDPLLFDMNNTESVNVEVYPENNAGLRVGTTAYHAERELDTLMYRDTGLYRDRQYAHANVLPLQTMYEEISILWDQEMKYRPNFSTTDTLVNMPVIFSKVSGIKNGDVPAYWSSIKRLLTPDTVLVREVPAITNAVPNPMRSYAAEFFRGGRLQRGKIKGHKEYPYSILREPMQDYLLDKMQFLIEQKLIRGTFENGTEYTIIATALNLDKQILRMIQKFDFTKKNPKLIYVIPGESALSLEDTIQAAFLNLVGFDVLFFVPTGYQCVERYFSRNVIEEHQIGEYMYDLQIPDFNTISANNNSRPSWRDIIFKRGT